MTGAADSGAVQSLHKLPRDGRLLLRCGGEGSRPEKAKLAARPGESAAGCKMKCEPEAEETPIDTLIGAVEWEERSNEEEWPAELVADAVREGRTVTRTADWASWANLGGAVPCEGVVLRVNHGLVTVKWDNGDLECFPVSTDGHSPLRLSPIDPKVPLAKDPAVKGPYAVDLWPVLSMEDAMKRTGDLLKEQVKSLSGLRCDLLPAWCSAVLQKLGPRLEVLMLVSARRRHVEALHAMPRLRELALLPGAVRWPGSAPQQPDRDEGEDVTSPLPLRLEGLYASQVAAERLLQVAAMPALRRLEVHCAAETPLAGLSFPRAAPPVGLQWLRSGVYPLRTALGLARAHAATLRELQLVAATSLPYGCPDLAGELRRCGLRALRRLLLLRVAVHGDACRHEEAACRRQKLDVWRSFVEDGLLVEVLCSECDAVLALCPTL